MNIAGKKEFIFGIVKFVLAGLGIAAFFIYVDFHKFAAAFLHINLIYFFAAFILVVFYMFTAGCEWFYLIKSFGYPKVRLKYCLRYILEVQFYNLLLSNFSGDIIRHFKVYKHINNKKDIAMIFLVNKAYTCFFLIVFGAIAVFFIKTINLSINLAVYRISSIIMAVALLIVLFSEKSKSVFYHLKEYRKKISKNIGFFMNALLVNILGRLVVVFIYYFICRSLDMRLSLLQIALVTFISAFGLFIPLNVAGLGAREGLNVLLLVNFGIPKEDAISFSLVAYAIFVILSVVGGTVELSGYGWKFKKLKNEYRAVKNEAIV